MNDKTLIFTISARVLVLRLGSIRRRLAICLGMKELALSAVLATICSTKELAHWLLRGLLLGVVDVATILAELAFSKLHPSHAFLLGRIALGILPEILALVRRSTGRLVDNRVMTSPVTFASAISTFLLRASRGALLEVFIFARCQGGTAISCMTNALAATARSSTRRSRRLLAIQWSCCNSSVIVPGGSLAFSSAGKSSRNGILFASTLDGHILLRGEHSFLARRRWSLVAELHVLSAI
jgi:hypothetical protein